MPTEKPRSKSSSSRAAPGPEAPAGSAAGKSSNHWEHPAEAEGFSDRSDLPPFFGFGAPPPFGAGGASPFGFGAPPFGAGGASPFGFGMPSPFAYAAPPFGVPPFGMLPPWPWPTSWQAELIPTLLDAMPRFAAARAEFWYRWYEAIARTAAEARQTSRNIPDVSIDVDKLEQVLKDNEFSGPETKRVLDAVRLMQVMTAVHKKQTPQDEGGPDW